MHPFLFYKLPARLCILPIFAVFIFLFCFVFSFKVAVNTVVPRSPFCAFCTPTDRYKHKIKCDRISASMQWRYLGHLQLLSKLKHSLTAMAKNEVCPRDEMADPPGTANIPIDRYGFTKGLVSFRSLCGVQSSLVKFAPNRAGSATAAGTVRDSVFLVCVGQN